MSTRLLVLAIVPLLLAACFSDVRDEPAPKPTGLLPPTASGQLEPTPTEAATSSASKPVPASTPSGVASPANTPDGTTGLRFGNAGAPRYDGACLAGETSVLPPASPLRFQQPAPVTEFPEPFAPSPFTRDEDLQRMLDEVVGDKAGSYAFYVKDVATGRGAVHNGDRVFNAASLFKLLVMYAVFHQESLGLIDWDDDLVVTPYYDAFALSPRVTKRCQVLTVGEAMDAMLSVSDNAAAVLLQDLAGSGNVNAAIEALGLKDSGLFEDGLPVTADDLALLMEAIAAGEAISRGASADMVRLLDHDVFENGLVAGVPEGTVVARKTGNWADATHVAGIVYAPFGPYVFVVLTSNGYETSIIEALSRTVYAYFEAAFGQRTPP